ncbi:hypothetical protein M8494_13595 [Serratia ureilytica]
MRDLYQHAGLRLASHASVSRLLYVMGRDNVFPEKFFGYIHLNGARRRSTC